MDWYAKIIKTASKPPSYLVERVSDIKHAGDMLKGAGSLREAKLLIDRIISQLEQHHDDDYVKPLKEACGVILDSPKKAKAILDKVAELMLLERDMHDSEIEEKKESWKKKL
jgi:hypothetical protein